MRECVCGRRGKREREREARPTSVVQRSDLLLMRLKCLTSCGACSGEMVLVDGGWLAGAGERVGEGWGEAGDEAGVGLGKREA